ncbi:hypothetical protein [Nostoc sp.]
MYKPVLKIFTQVQQERQFLPIAFGVLPLGDDSLTLRDRKS